MGVRANQYAREIEKNISRGKTTEQAHKRSAALASTARKPDKFDTPTIGDKIILGLLRRFKGKKKPLTPERTSQITSQLKKAGIDQKTIDRMRGKKK